MTSLGWFVLVVVIALVLVLFLLLTVLVERSKKIDAKKSHRFYVDYVSDFFGKNITVNEARRGAEHSELGMIFSMASEIGLTSVFGATHIREAYLNSKLCDRESSIREGTIIMAAHIGKYGPDKKITYTLSLK